MRHFAVVCAAIAIVAVACSPAFAQSPEDQGLDAKAKHSLWTLLGGSRLIGQVGKPLDSESELDGIAELNVAENLPDATIRLPLDSNPIGNPSNPLNLIPLLTSASSAPVTAADVVEVVETNRKGGGGGSGGRPFASPTYPWAQPWPP